MLSGKEIKNKLRELGFKEQNLDAVIADVNKIILNKALGNYFLRLSENERSKLKKLKEEELVKYIEAHKDIFPIFSTQEFKGIHNETWQNYFSAISK